MTETTKKKRSLTKSLLITSVWALVVSTCINSLIIYAEIVPFRENGIQTSFYMLLPLFFPCMILLLIVPCGIGMLFVKKYRLNGVKICIIALIYFCILFLSFNIADQVRESEINKLAERSMPLVESIKSYEKEHGMPPSSLKDLIPKYFDKVPTTGMGSFPNYEYLPGSGGISWGNPWILIINVPFPAIDSPKLIYVPLQNCPDSYNPQKIGEWVYLQDTF